MTLLHWTFDCNMHFGFLFREFRNENLYITSRWSRNLYNIVLKQFTVSADNTCLFQMFSILLAEKNLHKSYFVNWSYVCNVQQLRVFLRSRTNVSILCSYQMQYFTTCRCAIDLCPSNRQLLIQLQTKASSRGGQCIPAGCRVTLTWRVLINIYVKIVNNNHAHSRRFPANCVSDCLRFAKLRP